MTARLCRRAAVAAALAAALSSPPAAAQTTSVGDFRAQARTRLGPLYLAPSFTLERLGVDTNVFQSPEPERDLVVAATPRLDAWLPLPLPRRAVLAVSAAGGLDWYQRFVGERSINPEVSALIDAPAGRLRFFAGGRYLNTRRRPAFELRERARHVRHDAFAGVEVDLSTAVSLELRGRRERLDFDAAEYFQGTRLADVLNRDETSAAAVVRWRRTVLSTFTAEAEVLRARFPLSPDRDSNSVMARVGAVFHPRALVSGAGEVGVRRFTAIGPTMQDYLGLIARAEFSFRLGEQTTATAAVERAVEYSYAVNWPYYVLKLYRGQVRRRLSSRVDMVGQATREGYDYRRRVTVPVARSETRWTAGGQVGYRLNRRLRAGVDVRYVRWNAPSAAWRSLGGVEAGLVFSYGS